MGRGRREEPVDSIYGGGVLDQQWRIGERSSHPHFVSSFTYARSYTISPACQLELLRTLLRTWSDKVQLVSPTFQYFNPAAINRMSANVWCKLHIHEDTNFEIEA